MENLRWWLLPLLLTLLVTACHKTSNGNDTSDTCDSSIIKYTGPHDLNQLTKVLNESTDLAIQNLDTATKKSIIDNMIFIDGTPKGFKKNDDNIIKLFDSNAKDVFRAILGGEVIIVTFDSKPIVKHISKKDFMKINLRKDEEPVYSVCRNCYAPSNLYRCCVVGGEMCIDKLIKLNDTYYSVH